MKLFRNILRVLTTVAALLYLAFLIVEIIPSDEPEVRESNLGIVMVFVLFVWFGIGYYNVWKNEMRAGIMLTTWWIALFLTAWLIWYYGNVTIILGFPIFILGVLLLVYSWKARKSSASND